MMLIDLTEDLFLKNDATTRVPWMVLAGGEKVPENGVILITTERDDADILARFQLVACSLASGLRSRDRFRVV